MSSRFILPFADVGSGIKPSSGAKLFFFETDGVTPKNTFSDQLATPTPNANPVIADSNGVFGDIYIVGQYKVTLEDKNGSQIFGGAVVEELAHSFNFELNLINDLSQAYEFSTIADYKAFTTEFPLGKAIRIQERKARFLIISGTGASNTFNIIGSDQVNQSISLVLPNSNPLAWGAAGDGVTDDKVVLGLMDASGTITIRERHAIVAAGNIEFTNFVTFEGGALLVDLAAGVKFDKNDEIDVRWFGAIPDAVITGETVTGTDNTDYIQQALFSCATTNGKKTLVAGGGDYYISGTVRNFIAGTGTCSIIGKGLQGFRLVTDQDITALHVGGSAQTIKRIYVVFVNPTAALVNQVGVEFANDDFQWSQSVIEQVWVINAEIGFLQRDYTSGTFGTIFLNAYRNCQIVFSRSWGLKFDSKNGSTTIHLDTVYVKGSGTAAKGMFFRSIKDILLSNCAIDTCYNNLLDVAAVNLLNVKNLAIEACVMTNGAEVACNLNATNNVVDGFTSTITTVDVGVSTDSRILFFGGNATSGNSVRGFIELGTILTSGNFVKAAIAAAATRVQVTDDSVKLSETVDNGFGFGFGIKGQDFSRYGSNPDNSSLTGDRERGHVFHNAVAQTGQPKSWRNTTGGALSTYVSDGNL